MSSAVQKTIGISVCPGAPSASLSHPFCLSGFRTANRQSDVLSFLMRMPAACRRAVAIAGNNITATRLSLPCLPFVKSVLRSPCRSCPRSSDCPGQSTQHVRCAIRGASFPPQHTDSRRGKTPRHSGGENDGPQSCPRPANRSWSVLRRNSERRGPGRDAKAGAHSFRAGRLRASTDAGHYSRADARETSATSRFHGTGVQPPPPRS